MKGTRPSPRKIKIRLRVIGESLVVEIPLKRIHKLPELALPDLEMDLQVIRMRPQMRRVLSELLGGKTNKEISAKMNIGERTVKYYVSEIFRRLKVSNRGQVFCYFQGKDVNVAGL